MEEEIEDIKKKLKKYSQEHLLNNFKNLSEEKQKRLLEQIKNIDFDTLKETISKVEQDLQQLSSNKVVCDDLNHKNIMWDSKQRLH